jgi:hypothetical protein
MNEVRIDVFPAVARWDTVMSCDDVLRVMAGFLSGASLARLSSVNRALHKTLAAAKHWEAILHAHFPHAWHTWRLANTRHSSTARELVARGWLAALQKNRDLYESQLFEYRVRKEFWLELYRRWRNKWLLALGQMLFILLPLIGLAAGMAQTQTGHAPTMLSLWPLALSGTSFSLIYFALWYELRTNEKPFLPFTALITAIALLGATLALLRAVGAFHCSWFALLAPLAGVMLAILASFVLTKCIHSPNSAGLLVSQRYDTVQKALFVVATLGLLASVGLLSTKADFDNVQYTWLHALAPLVAPLLYPPAALAYARWFGGHKLYTWAIVGAGLQALMVGAVVLVVALVNEPLWTLLACLCAITPVTFLIIGFIVNDAWHLHPPHPGRLVSPPVREAFCQPLAPCQHCLVAQVFSLG